MQREPFAYGNFSPGFVRSLAGRLRGQRVLEVFAGNGLLAARLAAHGVDIRATSLFAGHDGHERGMHHPVEQLDAVAAVGRYGDVSDILLMSWPTVTEAAARAVLEWGSERAVVFVGEIPRPEWGMAGLSGCATDLFHEITDVVAEVPGYTGNGGLDRAVELRVDPERVARWHVLQAARTGREGTSTSVRRPLR